jgi:hypothetical protein
MRGCGQPPDLAAAMGAARGIGLITTGTAELSDERLIGVGLVRADAPLLLGADPRQIAELKALTLFFRNTSGSAPSTVQRWPQGGQVHLYARRNR